MSHRVVLRVDGKIRKTFGPGSRIYRIELDAEWLGSDPYDETPMRVELVRIVDGKESVLTVNFIDRNRPPVLDFFSYRFGFRLPIGGVVVPEEQKARRLL